MWRSSRKTRRAASVRPRLEMLEHRLTPAAGDLDLTFGTGGKVLSDFRESSWGNDVVAVQDDGKVVIAESEFGLLRYNADGSLDNDFGSGGKVTTSIGGPKYLIIQADGKILVAGSVYVDLWPVQRGFDFALERYHPDGSLDASFGSGGKVTTNFGVFHPAEDADEIATALAVQSDGKIIVAGHFHYDGSGYALARYNSDGSLDSTFDGDGKVTGVGVTYPVAVAVLGEDIVVAGGLHDISLVRHNANGSLDTTFGADGVVQTDFGADDYPAGMMVRADGKIIMAGISYDGLHSAFALARYNADGSLDTTLDGDGKVTTPLPGTEAWIQVVAFQSDGKIVGAGGTLRDSTGYDFAVWRFHADGSFDSSFDGEVVDFGADDEGATGVALQADGKIVVTGFSRDPSGVYDFAMARYHGATDSDGDGIADAVDTQPTIFSNDFSDGTTTGTITTRGGQVLTIVDAPNAAQGVVITAELSGDLNPAEVNVCNGASILSLTAGDQVIATCGSVILDVRAGPIEAAFLAESGQESTAILPTGNVLTFDPQTGTFSAPATNPDTIVVVIGGMETSVAPGVTFQPVQIDIKPVSDIDSTNLASQGLIAVSILTTAAFDAALVDVTSVYFAGAQAVHSALEDVDGDGDLDMVLHFRTQDTNLRALYEQLIADDLDGDGILDSNHQVAEVSLTGATVEDVLFAGLDQMDLFLSGRTLRELLEELAAAGAI